jgi:hypothetical protein
MDSDTNDQRKVATFAVGIRLMETCFMRSYDQWAMEIKGRLESCIDLPAEEAVYHRACYARFLNGRGRVAGEIPSGRPVNEVAQMAFEQLCEHLETMCASEKMYTLDDLRLLMLSWGYNEKDVYGSKSIKNKLKARYGEHMFFAEVRGRKNVLCFRDFVSHVLSDKWYNEREESQEEKTERIVRQAARLIAAQLREMEYDMEFYPDCEQSWLGGDKIIPPLLQLFLGQLVRNHKKQSGIAQAIVQATRPRSCIMPLLFALGIEIHRKHGAADLVKQLSRWGFCISLDEVHRFQQSVMQSNAAWQPVECREATFTHFIGDNVDHNIRTLTGSDTFHAMGIVAVSSFGPGQTVASEHKVRRLSKRLPVGDVCQDRRVQLEPYTGFPGEGLKNLKMVSIDYLQTPVRLPAFSNLTTLWQAGGLVCVNERQRPMWSGFMQAVCEGEHAPTSVVRMLPIIDLSPSDMTCIYTTLLFVKKQAEYLGIPQPSITFDQPLYIKAVDIVRHHDLNIVVRLGGFHTIMNYMGAIGSNMRGSGLEDAFELLYGKKTVEHVMTGKAYKRAVRGHMLVTSALTAMLMQKLMPQLNAEENQMPAVKLQDESVIDNLRLSEEQVSSLHKLYNDVLLRKVNVVDEAVQEGNDVNEEQLTSHVLQNNNSLLTLNTNLQLLCTLLAEQSRTAKLWIEYLKHIDILRSFIVAERTSNWEQHLNALSCMLPLFASQHHVNYAKSGFVYLQNMHDLEQKSPWLYQQFMNGLHSVRKSDRYWAGLSTDLVIEQDMMRQVKSKGGLTRGRGLEESTRTVWLNTVTECARISSTLAELSGTKRTADEHIEMTTPRIKRDADAMVKLTAFFQSYSPFQYQDTERLVGLSSGVCAGAHDNVTCDVANAVGLRIIQQWEGLMYPELTVRKVETVKTLAGMFSICKVGDEKQEIDASKLFQRLVILAYSQRSLQLSDVFNFELTVYPASLFKSGLMRKPDKPALLRNYCTGLMSSPSLHCSFFVVDGGCLLHKVRWLMGSTFGDLVSCYATFVARHFGNKAWIVFDGYTSGPTTKDHEHSRRTSKKASVAPDVHFDSCSVVTFDQEAFLSNASNKQRFISLLAQHLQDCSYHIRQSEGDADVDIAAVAVHLSRQGNAVVVYAEDTDILALLLYHWQPSMAPVHFKSDGKAKSAGKCVDVAALQNRIGRSACQKILVLHAFGGCDTTSAIFMHGKGKLFTQLSQNEDVVQYVCIMQDPDASMVQVCNAGVALMIAAYGGKTSDNLGQMRYAAYSKMVASKGGSFMADRLPPTEDAAELHAMRVHFQAVVWCTLGQTTLQPTDWGWRLQDGHMLPTPMRKQPGPPELMNIICCNCKSDKPCSSQLCTCRKNNLKCITACGHCHGVDCANAEILVADEHDDSDMESDCEGGNSGSLPDVMWDDDLEWVDEELVSNLGSEFIFNSDDNVACSYVTADDEIPI